MNEGKSFISWSDFVQSSNNKFNDMNFRAFEKKFARENGSRLIDQFIPGPEVNNNDNT